MNRLIFSYDMAEFSMLPRLLNKHLECGKNFAMSVHGQSIPDETFDAYFKFIGDFGVGFSFFPYCEMMPSVNRAFGKPNPLMDITLRNKMKVNAVRQVNCGAMFFDCSKLSGMRFDETLKFSFVDKFVDDIASIGAIPSNGVMLDVYESWNLFPRYKRIPFKQHQQYEEEIAKSGIVLDNDTAKVVKWLNTIKTGNSTVSLPKTIKS